MSILAWHWCAADRRLGYGDGREVVAGETLRHKGKIALCESGLHASAKILDALKFAPGPIICRVRLSGEVVRGNDKIVASERHTLWMVDATRALILWSADCAWAALQRVGSPDPRCVAELHEIMRQQRSGVRDAKRLEAAWAAARNTAWAAARDAAWDAARAAAWDAARAAAWDAARGAARNTAWGAAWDAARAAAWDAARGAARNTAWAAARNTAWAAARNTAWAAARNTAWDAARAAAWDAARGAQSLRLRRLIGLERRGEMAAEIARMCAEWGVSEAGGTCE